MKRIVLLLTANLIAISVRGAQLAEAAEFLFGPPTNLDSVNTSRSEYGSTISYDGLSLFISRGSNSCFGCDSDIYVARRADLTDPWGATERLGDSVNSDVTDGVPSISADGRVLYFSDRWSGNGRPRVESLGRGDLWVTRRDSTESPWGDAINLGEPINTRFEESGASISSDGLSLFFASDRRGGKGGLDIWFAERDAVDAPWSEPQNLSLINSRARDFSPKLSADRLSLFFTTERENRRWGNLWVTTRDHVDAAWAEPVSLGPTVNDPSPGITDGVDRSGHLSADGSTFYSSAWSVGGEFELFSFPVLPFERVSVRPGAEAYRQNFDQALGADGRETEISLPRGWTVSENGVVFDDSPAQRFPENSRIHPLRVASYNAGAEESADRTLAIGVKHEPDGHVLQLHTEVAEIDASGFQLQFDIEAWDAERDAQVPGEAAFDVTLQLDSGDGFVPLTDLGTISTGKVLQSPDGHLVDGNLDDNRVTFNSGIQSTTMPAGSKLRIRWEVPDESASSGWIFGLDNVALRLLDGVVGDLNGDGLRDVQDIDLLTAEILRGTSDPTFDLNLDHSVDAEDRRVWIEDLQATYFGDVNLDGEFNSTDLVEAFQTNEYEDGIPMNSTWATGDWDGDGDFTSGDLVLAFQGGGFEQGPRAVPEPTSLLLWIGGFACIAVGRRRVENGG